MNPYNMHPYRNMYNYRQPDNQAQQNFEQPEPEPELPPESSQNDDLPAMEDHKNIDNARNTENAKNESDAVNDGAEVKKLEKELEDERLRMAAEMDNFKKRLQREHQEQMRYASEKVLSDILPALDNLDLALQYGTKDEACSDMMQGIEMTRKQLLEAVGKNGLVPVGEKGEAFTPEIHEAIGMEADPSQEKGAVTRVLQPGYKLNGRLLRPAKVMVNN